MTAWHCMENICKMSFSSTKSWVDTSCTTYLWYNSISSHVTTKTQILTLELLFYLDGCRFTVNNVLILSNCNNNCINTWKVCTIIFRRLLFLKFTTAHRTNEKDKVVTKYNDFTDPHNTPKFLPSRRRKSFWFVEKRRLCRVRFLRPPYSLSFEKSTLAKSSNEHTRGQNGGNKILLGDVTSTSTNKKTV